MWCQKPALRSHTVMHVFIHIQIQMCITNSQSLFVKLWDWQSDFSYFFGFSHSTLRHDMHQHLKSVWQIFVSHAPTANRNQLERCTDVTTSRLEPSGRSAAPQPHREQSFSFLYVDFDVYYIVFFWLIDLFSLNFQNFGFSKLLPCLILLLHMFHTFNFTLNVDN